jgi:1,5-anhydro-D-fructose reductase (1,5-anhydro-D-mannitol-forming)
MQWGLIGASTIAADFMVGALRSDGQDDIGWVVSATQQHAASFAERHAIARATTSLADMLGDPQVAAVYISSTNEKHHSQAMAAIAAGKHVICEKPLAMNLPDACQMVDAAITAGVVFATNHHLRCSGSHKAIRAIIASGRIGKVLSVRLHHAVYLPPHLQGWRINDSAAGGGVIPDITVHDADTLRFLLDEDPVSVVAQAGTSGLGEGVEDSVMSVWSMPSGAMVMAHESFTHRFAGSGLEVHGTDGSIFAKDVMTQRPLGEINLVTAEGRVPVAFDAYDLYTQAVRQFRNAVAGKCNPAATGRDGMASLAIALAVREAALSGKRQVIRYGDLG